MMEEEAFQMFLLTLETAYSVEDLPHLRSIRKINILAIQGTFILLIMLRWVKLPK